LAGGPPQPLNPRGPGPGTGPFTSDEREGCRAAVSFLTGADRAPGAVVSLDWRAGHSTGTSRTNRTNSGPMAYPFVEFTPAHGTPRTFRGSTGSNPPPYETGDRVEVLYHANSPGDARLTRRRPANSGPSASQRGSRPDVPASSRVG